MECCCRGPQLLPGSGGPTGWHGGRTGHRPAGDLDGRGQGRVTASVRRPGDAPVHGSGRCLHHYVLIDPDPA